MGYVGKREEIDVDRAEKLAQLQMHYSTRAKSVATTYVLWFFLGLWGIHRFYLGQTQLGLLTIGACILLSILAMFTHGLTMIPLVIWWVIEMFTLIGTVRSINLAIEEDLRRQLGIRGDNITASIQYNSPRNSSTLLVVVVLLAVVFAVYFVFSNRHLILNRPASNTTITTPVTSQKLWHEIQNKRISIVGKKNPQLNKCLSEQFQARFLMYMLAGCECKVQISDKKILRHCTTRAIAKHSAKDCLLQSRITMKSALTACNNK